VATTTAWPGLEVCKHGVPVVTVCVRCREAERWEKRRIAEGAVWCESCGDAFATVQVTSEDPNVGYSETLNVCERCAHQLNRRR
jgi:hypothetical protein